MTKLHSSLDVTKNSQNLDAQHRYLQVQLKNTLYKSWLKTKIDYQWALLHLVMISIEIALFIKLFLSPFPSSIFLLLLVFIVCLIYYFVLLSTMFSLYEAEEMTVQSLVTELQRRKDTTTS